MILDHQVSARRPKALWLIGAFWIGLAVAYVKLDAAWWILAPLALLSLPAILEAARNDSNQLRLDQTQLSWSSRRSTGAVPVAQIARIRFDTRLDLAVNARVYLTDGRVLRLPVECVPPYQRFCTALDTAGIDHERHHFSVF